MGYSNVNTMALRYGDWTVKRLKVELLNRGAAVTGRKKDLVERYDMCCVYMCKINFLEINLGRS